MGPAVPAACAYSYPRQEVLEAAAGVVTKLPVRDNTDLPDSKPGQILIDVTVGTVQNRFVVEEHDVTLSVAAKTKLHRMAMLHSVSDIGPDGVIDILKPTKLEERRDRTSRITIGAPRVCDDKILHILEKNQAAAQPNRPDSQAIPTLKIPRLTARPMV